jgi:Tfp pilus assembly protein PilN
MPHINLIHEQRAGIRRREAQARAGLLLFACSIGLTAVGSGVLLLQSQAVRGEEDRLRAELRRLEPISKQIEANGAEMGNLSPRLKTLEDARLATDRWRRILDHLAVNTPKDTWLSYVRSTADDPTKPVEVTVSGMGTAQAPIGELLLRTQNCTDLENVNLRFTEERVTASVKAIQFEFVANVTGTMPDAPGMTGGKK